MPVAKYTETNGSSTSNGMHKRTIHRAQSHHKLEGQS